MKMRAAFRGKKEMPVPIKGGVVLDMPHKTFRPIKDWYVMI